MQLYTNYTVFRGAYLTSQQIDILKHMASRSQRFRIAGSMSTTKELGFAIERLELEGEGFFEGLGRDS